jgi:hypothetical protein
MAVWIYVYGKNGLLTEDGIRAKDYLDILNSIPLDEIKILNSISESKNPNFSIRQVYNDNRRPFESYLKSMTAKQYKAYLDSINLPYIEIKNIVDHFITDGEQREKEMEMHFNSTYDKIKNSQTKSKWKLIENGYFVNNLTYLDKHDGLRMSLVNDLIRISGPFSVFSSYSCFQKGITTDSRDYYHSYFKSVLKAFKSDFIQYCHEWSGLDDDDNNEFDLSDLIEQSNCDITSSDSIHTMDKFYFEQL